MPPNAGLVHPKEYDIKDSNVELIGSDIDHRVKYTSASAEPAWNDGRVGRETGLRVWRIEQFQVVPWPAERYGQFYDGDSYIVLHSYQVGQGKNSKLGHDIFFWLGSHTTQDEAGTAAYKTVELDEFLRGAATQHREVQCAPSDEFLALFPTLSIRSGGVRSGFRHVEEPTKEEITTLLRVFTNPAGGRGVVVYEVEPTWKSLDDGDVFVLDKGDKIWVWQGKDCSPMEKAKAAQVVHDMTLAKHIDVEVLAQAEARSRRVVEMLGGDDETPREGFRQGRPLTSSHGRPSSSGKNKRLFRLSDASGQLQFDLIKDGPGVSKRDLDPNDVFLLDDAGQAVWVWEGQGASHAERSRWLQVARQYINWLQTTQDDAYLIPLAKVNDGYESKAFLKAIEV
jgi:gelsolin